MSKIVLGCLFGDEGKGMVTRWLARGEEKPVIVRFSGGPQSAHTVISRETGLTHICSSFGSGVFEGIPTVYHGGYFDVCGFVEECKSLESKGIPIPRIYLHTTKMMYPHDVWLGRRGDREKRDGTCGKGIYQAYIRPDYSSTFELTKYWEEKGIGKEDMDNLWSIWKDASCSKYVRDYLMTTSSPSEPRPKIIEGTQGLLLDMNHGFYPNVTPSLTGLEGVRKAGLLGECDEVYLVLRSYLTRHGNGYTPKFPLSPENPYETNVRNEFQGDFKTGKMETDLIRRALDRHSLDVYQKKYGLKINVVITCLDVYTPDLQGIKKTFTDILDVSCFYGSWGPWSDQIRELP